MTNLEEQWEQELRKEVRKLGCCALRIREEYYVTNLHNWNRGQVLIIINPLYPIVDVLPILAEALLDS